MPKNSKPKRRRGGQPAPVWRKFMDEARARIVATEGGFKPGDALEQIGQEIVRAGEGEKFLKAARRGRATQRQNLRYRILREVERLSAGAVPRRRPDANTPDAQALKGSVRLELEAYAEAGRMPAATAAAPVVHQGGKIKRLVSMIAGKFKRASRAPGI